jgi:isopenicillin-N N-acyltransferase-like protein
VGNCCSVAPCTLPQPKAYFCQIGLHHGKTAVAEIGRTITFYKRTFNENTGLQWHEVEQTALAFTPLLQSKYPAYLDEIRGIAEGSDVNFASILALNVRTEITYGLMKDDGCTTLAWNTPSAGFLAQNWDWQTEQKQNLIVLCVEGAVGNPDIKMITEAGIIGKIGLNSAGVGVCLNAINARGVNTGRLPVHLGLRLCLESRSREEAVRMIKQVGIAAACTITVADATGAVALECSSLGIYEVATDQKGRLFHSNHYLKPHEGVIDRVLPRDTLERVKRIEVLADKLEGEVKLESIANVFKDEEGRPGAICRSEQLHSKSATLFNIVMDLKEGKARIVLGKPVEPEETFWLEFGAQQKA